jgi:pimeloyl-ACP methyl ester carboxylesterase
VPSPVSGVAGDEPYETSSSAAPDRRRDLWPHRREHDCADAGWLRLCATYPGTGAIAAPSLAALRVGSDFPANQVKAYDAFKAAIAEYPSAPPAPIAAKTAQSGAVANWWDGSDPTGRKTTRISAPTLVADGTDDRLDPVANDHALTRVIPGARLVLYPDAGHGFLFQDGTRFASVVESFLTGHSSS